MLSVLLLASDSLHDLKQHEEDDSQIESEERQKEQPGNANVSFGKKKRVAGKQIARCGKVGWGVQGR